MSNRPEQIADHNIFRTLESFDSLLKAIDKSSKLELQSAEAFNKAKAIVAYVSQRINQSDPLLTPASVLDSLDDNLQGALQSIANYTQNNNFSHWLNALVLLDQCCIQITQIPSQSATAIEDMFKTSAEYKRSISKLFSSITEDFEELSIRQNDLQQKIVDTHNEINNQKQRLDTAISAYQQQFSDSQQTRQSDFAASEQSRQATAQANEESRQHEYEAVKERYIQTFEKLSANATRQLSDLSSDVRGAAEDTLHKIATQLEYAQKLVGIIANTGMAHGFQKTANEERKQAFIWSIVAVVAMLIWITVGCVFFAFTYDLPITLPSVIRQFLISTPFVLLSGFAAIRVAQHQKNERAMRKSELEIASIDPFLATLSDDDRNEVKREFATRYFGQREVQEKNEPVPSNLVELAGALVKVVQDLTKK